MPAGRPPGPGRPLPRRNPARDDFLTRAWMRRPLVPLWQIAALMRELGWGSTLEGIHFHATRDLGLPGRRWLASHG